MDEDKITPQYIVEQSKILSDEELLELIENYGYQECDRGSNYASYDY